MNKVQYLVISEDNHGRRLDNFLIGRFKNLPKSLVYRIIRRGEVRVNKGRIKQDYRLQAGDRVRMPPVRLDEGDTVIIPKNRIEQLRDNIIYAHQGVIIVNKPSGLAAHSGSGLAYGLIEVAQRLYPAGQVYLVHRLDRETSGCLMLTQSMSTLRALHEQFKTQQINKHYLALLQGKLKRNQCVNQPLLSTVRSGERYIKVDSAGKTAETNFEVIDARKNATLVRAKPLTGRTHQIRAHAAHLGHPLLGDKRYGDKAINLRMREDYQLKRLFLHAESMIFTHPVTGMRVKVDAPLDNELKNVLRACSLENKLGKSLRGIE